MTWPVLPASTVLARVLDTTVLFSQQSGVLAKVNDVGAFVLDHRAHFTDHSDAAGELTALLGADPQEVESDLRALEKVLDELTSEVPPAIDPQLGPVRHPPSSAPVARWSLDALGMAIEVDCHSEQLVDIITPLLAAHPPPATSPDHRFEVWDDDGITVTQDGHVLVDRAGVDRAVNGLITGITVLVILAEREGLLLHGGAVAERGSAVLIGGGSGAGKSTTTVELLAEGMSFLTDELVELDPGAGSVRGFPRPIGLEGPARSWRPQLRPPWAGDEELHRWPVPPRSLGSIVERAQLELVVHLEYTEAATTTIDPLDPLEALGRLCSSVFNRDRVTASTLTELAELLSAVPSSLVRHDGAPQAARAIVERWRQVRGVCRR